jgi:hypothetical protein
MELEFHTPATYRIRFKGCLGDNWSDRLGGMTIEVSEQEEGAREATLVGRLADQAALLGVLNTLYGLHLPLLSVEYVGSTQA